MGRKLLVEAPTNNLSQIVKKSKAVEANKPIFSLDASPGR